MLLFCLQILDNLSVFFSSLIFVKAIKLAKKKQNLNGSLNSFGAIKNVTLFAIRFQSFFIVKIYNMLITTILLMPKTSDIT